MGVYLSRACTSTRSVPMFYFLVGAKGKSGRAAVYGALSRKLDKVYHRHDRYCNFIDTGHCDRNLIRGPSGQDK